MCVRLVSYVDWVGGFGGVGGWVRTAVLLLKHDGERRPPSCLPVVCAELLVCGEEEFGGGEEEGESHLGLGGWVGGWVFLLLSFFQSSGWSGWVGGWRGGRTVGAALWWRLWMETWGWVVAMWACMAGETPA